MADAYRVDWWVALPSQPGEWAGRWDLAADADAARAIAAAALAAGCELDRVRLTALATDGGREERVVVDAVTLTGWAADIDRLPQSGLDPQLLPPLGRDDIEVMTLARCREALVVARTAELISADHVAAIVEIVQQAFCGVGPAAEIAGIIAGAGIPQCGR